MDDLQLIKEDLWRLLEAFNREDIEYALTQIESGNIDGAYYYPPNESHCYVCLVGNLVHNHPELSIKTWKQEHQWVNYYGFLTKKLGIQISPSTLIEEYINPISPQLHPHNNERLENIYNWIKEYLNERSNE